MELHEKIKQALMEIKFIERYEELSNRFNRERIPTTNRLVYVDGEEIMNEISNLGYIPQFNTKEKFYKIEEEKFGDFIFGVHIILQSGMVDLVWIVKNGEELLLGSPWSTYSRRLIDINYRIKKPVFGTYKDLDEILEYTFEMYEDFKKALVHI